MCKDLASMAVSSNRYNERKLSVNFVLKSLYAGRTFIIPAWLATIAENENLWPNPHRSLPVLPAHHFGPRLPLTSGEKRLNNGSKKDSRI